MQSREKTFYILKGRERVWGSSSFRVGRRMSDRTSGMSVHASSDEMRVYCLHVDLSDSWLRSYVGNVRCVTWSRGYRGITCPRSRSSLMERFGSAWFQRLSLRFQFLDVQSVMGWDFVRSTSTSSMMIRTSQSKRIKIFRVSTTLISKDFLPVLLVSDDVEQIVRQVSCQGFCLTSDWTTYFIVLTDSGTTLLGVCRLYWRDRWSSFSDNESFISIDDVSTQILDIFLIKDPLSNGRTFRDW